MNPGEPGQSESQIPVSASGNKAMQRETPRRGSRHC